MRAPSLGLRIALLAATVSLAVALSGCVAQDRPHEPSFWITAEAGEGEIVGPADTAHLHFDAEHALEPVGESHVEEHAELEWTSSSGAHGNGSNFTITPASPGLVLVELNVTAANHTVTDVAGVLAVPGGPGPRRAFIGVVGDVRLVLQGGEPFAAESETSLGSHEGRYYAALAPGSSVRLAIVGAPEGSEAAFLISLKSGGGTGEVNTTPPLLFDGALIYSLVLDTSGASAHHIEARDAAGAPVEDLSLAAFAEAHGGEAEGRFLVAPKGQTLPGFEAPVAAFAFAVAALAFASRRR